MNAKKTLDNILQQEQEKQKDVQLQVTHLKSIQQKLSTEAPSATETDWMIRRQIHALEIQLKPVQKRIDLLTTLYNLY